MGDDVGRIGVCTTCGREIASANARFCPGCGTPLAAVESPSRLAEPHEVSTGSVPNVPESPPAARPMATTAAAMPSDTVLPSPAPVSSSTPSASYSEGQTVAFVGMSREARQLREGPRADARGLPEYLIGRVKVVAVAGQWVQIRHSSGTVGWVPASRLRMV